MTSNQDRIVNVLLRVTTLGTRFIFIVVLAKLLTPAEVGYYGLFAATVGYAMLLVGLDFFAFATREMLRAPSSERGKIIKAQAALACLVYILLAPALIFLLTQLGWPTLLLWWFIPILILEHLNQEIARVLIALSQQVFASIVLFIRQGSWAIGVLILLTFNPEYQRLDVVFPSWAVSGVLAAVLGVWKIRQLKMGGWGPPIEWSWIIRGLYVGLGFLAATLALRATQTIDRYWLEALTDVETLAAYVLFFGMAASLLAFLDAGVFAFSYPKLISMYQDEDINGERALMRTTLIQTVAVALAFSLVSLLILPSIIDWIDDPTYKNAQGLYLWVLAAVTLNAVSLVPHYGLYAKGQDRPIIHSHIAGLLAFILSTWSLSGAYAELAVPIGLSVSFLVILLWKAQAYVRTMRYSST